MGLVKNILALGGVVLGIHYLSQQACVRDSVAEGMEKVEKSVDLLKGYQPFNCLPKNDHLEDGFAKPSDLEFRLVDEDKNGQKELIMMHRGQQYYVFYDPQIKRVEVVCEDDIEALEELTDPEKKVH